MVTPSAGTRRRTRIAAGGADVVAVVGHLDDSVTDYGTVDLDGLAGRDDEPAIAAGQRGCSGFGLTHHGRTVPLPTALRVRSGWSDRADRDASAGGGERFLYEVKTDPGVLGTETFCREVAKLERVKALGGGRRICSTGGRRSCSRAPGRLSRIGPGTSANPSTPSRTVLGHRPRPGRPARRRWAALSDRRLAGHDRSKHHSHAHGLLTPEGAAGVSALGWVVSSTSRAALECRCRRSCANHLADEPDLLEGFPGGVSEVPAEIALAGIGLGGVSTSPWR